MPVTRDVVRAMALRLERERAVVRWAVLVLAPLFLAAFLYNVVEMIHAPWLIAGQILAMATFCSIAGPAVWNKRDEMSAEPSVAYLRRVLENKRRGLRRIRRSLLLLIAAVVASWFGGGPAQGARMLGIHHPAVLSALRGPAPLLVLAPVIAFIWFSFRHQGQNADRELQRLDRTW